MTGPLSPQARLQPLQLYRYLLREASYLPNLCRPFVIDRIRSSFRKPRRVVCHATKSGEWGIQPGAQIREQARRTQKAYRDGHKALRSLRAVNAGDQRRLRRVLLHALGRLGKRRRELMVDLLYSDPPQDSEALEARLEKLILEDGANTENTENTDVSKENNAGRTAKLDEKGRPMPTRVQDNWDISKVQAFVNSQQQQQNRTSTYVWHRSPVKFQPPAKAIKAMGDTIWDTPMPERRVRKRLDRYWKATAEKLSPPIGRMEWENIAAAARGELPDDQWKLRPRRTAAQPTLLSASKSDEPSTTTADKSWNWRALASRSISRNLQPSPWSNWRLCGEKEVSPYVSQFGRSGVPDRQMRRRYQHIWQTTPYQDRDPRTNHRNWTWGTVPLTPPLANAAQAKLLENAPGSSKFRSKRHKLPKHVV